MKSEDKKNKAKALFATHCKYCNEKLTPPISVKEDRKPYEVLRHCENPSCDWCARCIVKARKAAQNG